MNIRKFWRLTCLTVASLFWASCSDSNPQFPMSPSANPDSSSDANESSSSELSSSAVAPESSSSDSPPQSSSSESASSSSGVESSSSHSPISSSSSAEYVLARDPSVSCEKVRQQVSICAKEYSCDELKTILEKKQSVSEKLLSSWEEELESCEGISEMSPAVYGCSPCCSTKLFSKMWCSNGDTYAHYVTDENKKVYTSIQEYNEIQGIVPENLTESCPQGEYALFVDVLADVQTTLYEKLSKQLEENSSLTEKGKAYLERLLDQEKKALKGFLYPYLFDYYEDSGYGYKMKQASKNWFNGYIAKTKTCEDGTPVITERYQQKYDAILAECIEIIENEVKAASAEE
ncbi:hypothetical protein [Fibrobacter sp. UWB11]|uniref:hypothetical protein n=1 Tax=Fibrobacter sp. UWB11 TaxID=1896202 RepID=UPI00092665F3|nr:hypothetical protein [Fibrobacter sp. UWB11]SIO13320.1 hypothetical protein SAMN05720758_1588 [Fibrobacter sp. UWB11]